MKVKGYKYLLAMFSAYQMSLIRIVSELSQLFYFDFWKVVNGFERQQSKINKPNSRRISVCTDCFTNNDAGSYWCLLFESFLIFEG